MLQRIQKISVFAALFLATALPSRAQALSEEYLRDGIAFLSSDLCTGRASGSVGALEAAAWVRRQFVGAGLTLMGSDGVQTFRVPLKATSALAPAQDTPMLQYEAQPLDSAAFCLAVPAGIPRPAAAPSKGKTPAHISLPPSELCRIANSNSSQCAPAPTGFEKPKREPFETGSVLGRNVLGMMSGTGDKYVILAAHYDNLGVLSGKMYRGADSNASGVTALTALARDLCASGRKYSVNIIFVGLDAKQLNLAGSQELYRSIAEGRLKDPLTGKAITKDKVALFINMDILGSTQSPLHSVKSDYLIMLTPEPQLYKDDIRRLSRSNDFYLDLAFDYYGSKGFTEMFLRRVSDQRPFLEGGVPSIMFTSGITMETNKVGDVLEGVDIPIMCRRTRLIYLWLDEYLKKL